MSQVGITFMITEFKSNKRIVNKDIHIETDIDAVLKEFNFHQVSLNRWKMEDFTIIEDLVGEDRIPFIYLYYKEECIVKYNTYFHRMWWYADINGESGLKQINNDSDVINHIMKHIRNKWSLIK